MIIRYFFLAIFALLVSTKEVDTETIKDVFTEDEKLKLQKSEESFAFQAEVTRLMDIIINSLYSNREVFLREIVSNALDALEKFRIKSLTGGTKLKENEELNVMIEVDKKENTITIRDNGIGFTKDELINNLGTIAKSGTANFLKTLKETGDINLIGQFGVGFYSAFLVGNEVMVTSKSDEDPDQHIWRSSVNGSYTIAKDPRGNTLGRGTIITIFLKNDAEEFLDEKAVRDHVARFSEFSEFPIYMGVNKESEVKPEDEKKDTKEESKPDSTENEILEDQEKEEEIKPSEKSEATPERKWELINVQKPLWTRPISEIKYEEYVRFYNSMGMSGEPLAYTHFKAEGDFEFTALVYIPEKSDDYQWTTLFQSKQNNIKLYSRRVLITDSVYEMLPNWISFVKGIVDSDDLPLKVDRENYTQTRIMKSIKKKLVNKVLDLFRQMSNEDLEVRKNNGPRPTKFEKLLKEYEKQLWLGCADDDQHREKILSLLRVKTSVTGPKEFVTLEEFLNRNPGKSIYYLTAEDYESAIDSPHIKIFKQKNVEVIIINNQLCEMCFEKQRVYKDQTFESIEKLGKLPEELQTASKEQRKLIAADFKPLVVAMKTLLKDKVGGVKISHHLVEDPAVVSGHQQTPSAYADRIARTHAFVDNYNGFYNKRLLINPNHPLIQKMLTMVKENEEDPNFKYVVDMLYNFALLNGGYYHKNPSEAAQTMFKLLQKHEGLDPEVSFKQYEPQSTGTPSTDDKSTKDKSFSDDLDEDEDTEIPPFKVIAKSKNIPDNLQSFIDKHEDKGEKSAEKKTVEEKLAEENVEDHTEKDPGLLDEL